MNTEAVSMARHKINVSRPYADKTIPELLKILDENFIALRKVEPDAGIDMCVIDVEGWPDQFTTFLKDPASEEQINEIEERLAEEIRKAKDRSEEDGDDEEGDDEPEDEDEANEKQTNGTKSPTTNNNTHHPGVENGEEKATSHLPKDYKTFLRHSNGYFVTDADDQTCLFYSTSAIDFNIAKYHDFDFTLFENPIDLSDSAQIPLGAFRGCSVGAGGDEGALILITPECTREILDEFESVYRVASEEVKGMYEEVARERFGGLEALRKCECLVLELTDSGADHELYLGFREYLEGTVGYVVGEREKVEGEQRGVKREGEGEGDGLEGRKRRKVDGDDEDEGDDDDNEDGSDENESGDDEDD